MQKQNDWNFTYLNYSKKYDANPGIILQKKSKTFWTIATSLGKSTISLLSLWRRQCLLGFYFIANERSVLKGKNKNLFFNQSNYLTSIDYCRHSSNTIPFYKDEKEQKEIEY